MVSGRPAGTPAGWSGSKAGIKAERHPQNYTISIMTNPGIGAIVVTVKKKRTG